MGNVLLHKHLIINADIANPPLENDLPIMYDWFKDLIESINMKILMGPYLVYSNMLDNEGFTGAAIIETSHIAMHCWDKCNPAKMKFDVYTCSTLHVGTIFDKIQIFKPLNIEYLYIDRETELSIIEKGKL